MSERTAARTFDVKRGTLDTRIKKTNKNVMQQEFAESSSKPKIVKKRRQPSSSCSSDWADSIILESNELSDEVSKEEPVLDPCNPIEDGDFVLVKFVTKKQTK